MSCQILAPVPLQGPGIYTRCLHLRTLLHVKRKIDIPICCAKEIVRALKPLWFCDSCSSWAFTGRQGILLTFALRPYLYWRAKRYVAMLCPKGSPWMEILEHSQYSPAYIPIAQELYQSHTQVNVNVTYLAYLLEKWRSDLRRNASRLASVVKNFTD